MTDEKRKRYDALWMGMAVQCAQMSHARRRKVGSVIVKDGRVISTGWNGTPAGEDNNCEDEKIETMNVDVHPKRTVFGMPKINEDDGCCPSPQIVDIFHQTYQEDIDDLLNEGWKILDFETGLLERRTLITKSNVLHSELNCILKLAQSTESARDATLYITLSPCVECAKIIKQSGIKRVVYLEDYRDPAGVDALKNNKQGIIVEKFDATDYLER